MAKRKRLTPPGVNYLVPDSVTDESPPARLETKAIFPSYLQGAGSKMRSPSPPIAHVARDAATNAALAEVTAALQSARTEGRMLQSLTLNKIDAAYLVRDRLGGNDEDMDALRASLKARGQQTPIEVLETGQGGFGLISGWRRLTALQQLHAETGEDRFATVLALVRHPIDAADAYVAMVEENEIRVGLSYYERARIVSRAVEEGVYPDIKKALNCLFGSSSRAKRSKIKSFLPVVEVLGPHLSYPTAIGERLGLALSQKLQAEPNFANQLAADLMGMVGEISSENEQTILNDAIRPPPIVSSPKASVRPAEATRETLAPGLWIKRSAGVLTIGGPSLTSEVEACIRAALRL